ncbi:DUF4261 domain-containing protein [Ectopseudomonas khazarica]|uniref:DUF4261 domain-containing protein n=1 Tax=Ectopseudomonas khazarica TaxID=2502979 RepID=UPI002FE2805E
MSIFSRFFGRRDDAAAEPARLVANPASEGRVSLQVLFPAALQLDQDELTRVLRAYHPEMAAASCEVSDEVEQFFALAGWGEHVVRLLGFDAPFPAQSLESCVAPAHYPQALKDEVRAHASHVLLYYAGHDDDPLEQYVVLAAVAGALAHFGAIAVLNESGRTSLPAAIFNDQGLGRESLDVLRGMPLTALYCGFVKYDVEGVQGTWMRTYGGGVFGIADFAVLAEGHHEGERYSELFDNVMSYLLSSGAQMAPGHTLRVGEDAFMRLRAPLAEEYFLDGPDPLLVAEIIAAHEANPA